MHVSRRHRYAEVSPVPRRIQAGATAAQTPNLCEDFAGNIFVDLPMNVNLKLCGTGIDIICNEEMYHLTARC